MSRLPVQPGERIDRATPITFTFDGKPVQGFAGDTIASALYAQGRRIEHNAPTKVSVFGA